MTDSDLYPWTVSKDYELARLVKKEPHIYRKPKDCKCEQYTKAVNKTWTKLARAMRTTAGKCKTRWAFLLKRHKNFVKTSTKMGRRSFLKNSAKALHPALSFIDDFDIDSRPVCPCTQKNNDDNKLKNKLKRSFYSEKPEEDKFLIRNYDQYIATNNSILFIMYSNQRKCLHNFLRGDKKYKRLLNLV